MHLNEIRARGFRASADTDLVVNLPGRFSVIVGANAGGKTTALESLVLAHRRVFPRIAPPNAAALGARPRQVEVAYRLGPDVSHEGPMGRELNRRLGVQPGAEGERWVAELNRDLGVVRSRPVAPGNERITNYPVIYLPAWRNPVDELGRREVRVLIELLRARQQANTGSRNLAGLRNHASSLLTSLTDHEVIKQVETLITEHLASLTQGVQRQWPFVRNQVVDDQYLARVLEIMLAGLNGRDGALPLDVSGLGYVNLLHIAVTLAAIPEAQAQADLEKSDPTENPFIAAAGDEQASSEAPERPDGWDGAVEEAEAREDSFFSEEAFHATVVIEEPEAHLHPQLQVALVRYLRGLVKRRPELQVILSSHAPELIAACDPEEIVAMRRGPSGELFGTPLADIPMTDQKAAFYSARLHLDATRSSALFSDRLLVVEGVTDAAVARELGYAWAGDDAEKIAFVDALSIVFTGSQIGRWPIQLLATKGYEIASRIAIIGDSDKPASEVPTTPTWLDDHSESVVRMEFSKPTLEPTLAINKRLTESALATIGHPKPAPSADDVEELFRGESKAQGLSAGPANRKKGEFALAYGAEVRSALNADEEVRVPEQFVAAFCFLFSGEEDAADLGAGAEVPTS